MVLLDWVSVSGSIYYLTARGPATLVCHINEQGAMTCVCQVKKSHQMNRQKDPKSQLNWQTRIREINRTAWFVCKIYILKRGSGSVFKAVRRLGRTCVFVCVHRTLESSHQSFSSFSAACEDSSAGKKSKPQMAAGWWGQPGRKGAFTETWEVALLTPAEVQGTASFVWNSEGRGGLSMGNLIWNNRRERGKTAA